MNKKRVAIVGTVGIPATYGGFETLVENLSHYHSDFNRPEQLTVYCSRQAYSVRPEIYLKTRLKYVPFYANGFQSVIYDLISLVFAVLHRSDVIVLLGVSGAFGLPLVRLFSSAKIITNIDGIEWRREKWNGVVSHFLRWSEYAAVKFSHTVVSDNEAIRKYVLSEYGRESSVIAYGGDHAVNAEIRIKDELDIPANYAFKVCRIEPENNIDMVLEAFTSMQEIGIALVIVGNWNSSAYGKSIREKYSDVGNILMLDPIYDLGVLKVLRMNSSWYVHGHSAGGTNPSLVEIMHFGIPVLAFDCAYNRETTDNKAIYFNSKDDIIKSICVIDKDERSRIGSFMKEIAMNKYKWDLIGRQYFELIE